MTITTNLTFDKWSEAFDDPVLTGAIVDRAAHKTHIVDMAEAKDVCGSAADERGGEGGRDDVAPCMGSFNEYKHAL